MALNHKINQSLFEESNRRFSKHLEAECNKRIIFSGRFGLGKSTFIQHYFEDKKQYSAIHLYPVNYAIASNEDIFKYIKYDIICEMIVKQYQIENEDFTKWQSLPLFLKKNSVGILATALAFVPLIGKDLSDMAKEILSLHSRFDIEHKELNAKGNESEIAKAYLNAIEQKEGLHENGLETELIKSILKREKDNPTRRDSLEDPENIEQQNVLIIDDLDRIDPEHIFRILNIFAAHFDQSGANENKFGFDKIILICDIENIRSIFRHRYGMSVDFNGYIDKFYSHNVFEFINREALRNLIDGLLRYDMWEKGYEHNREILRIQKAVLNDNFLHTILTEFCFQGLVTLRNIYKWAGNSYSSDTSIMHYGKEYSGLSHPILIKMDILVLFAGNKKNLIELIERLDTSKMIDVNFDREVKALLFFHIERQKIIERNGSFIFRFDGKMLRTLPPTYSGEYFKDVLDVTTDDNLNMVPDASFLVTCMVDFLRYF